MSELRPDFASHPPTQPPGAARTDAPKPGRRSTVMAVLAVFSILVGVAASLFMVVMLLAGGANAKPETITQIKWLMVATALVGVLGIAGAIWAFTQGRHGLSSAVGIAPLAFVIVLMIVLVKLEW